MNFLIFDMTENRVESCKSSLAKANSVAIVLRENPVLDDVLAGLSLYQWLLNEGFYAFVLCPVEVSLPKGLDGAEKILLKPRGQELVISWPNNQDDIEEVRTQINESSDSFELIIKSKNGSAPVAIQDLSFEYQNTQVDVVVMVGDARESLKQYTELYESVAKGSADWGYIGMQELQGFKGTWNLVDGDLGANCAQVVQLGQMMGWDFDASIASQLLLGMEHRTQRFSQPDLSAEFFELVAECLRAGGQRRRLDNLELPVSTPEIQQPKPQQSEIARPQR